jgi:hypothetical protein
LEYPLRIATVFAGVALADRGRVSLDGTIGWMWGRVAVGGGLLAGLAIVAARAPSDRARRAGGDLHDGAAASPIA